jgi:DNA invertase Pin-like site-specific DNA recombinase
MLGVFGEFETNLRKERQMEGIAKAKERGVYKGRKPSVDVERVKALRDSGMGCVCDCEGNGNRQSECISGTRLGSTQHPLYFLRIHSRARFCAVEMLAGVIIPVTLSLFLDAPLLPDVAAILHHI